MAENPAGVVQVTVATRVLIALAACTLGADVLPSQTPPTTPPAQPAPQPGRGGGGGGGGRGGIRIMTLTSSAFPDGGQIPMKYTQQGRDVSPPLAWTGAPDSTRSFVLIVHDADAAIGDGNDDMLHWMVWGVPGSATSLPEGIPQGPQIASSEPAGAGGRGGANAGTRQISGTGPYYRGPAAPSTGPAHHYLFELYALDANVNVPAIGASPPLTRAAVLAAMATHIRGKAVLVGLYRRAAP